MIIIMALVFHSYHVNKGFILHHSHEFVCEPEVDLHSGSKHDYDTSTQYIKLLNANEGVVSS